MKFFLEDLEVFLRSTYDGLSERGTNRSLIAIKTQLPDKLIIASTGNRTALRISNAIRFSVISVFGDLGHAPTAICTPNDQD